MALESGATNDPFPLQIAVVVVSDSVVAGTREDRSGVALCSAIVDARHVCFGVSVVPDEVRDISSQLRRLSAEGADVILTTGGTGFGSRDVTPEATAEVIERSAPGLAEAIRRESDRQGRGFGMLSRGIAGVVGKTLIVNLPGSPNGAREGWDVVLPQLRHIVELMKDRKPH